MMSLSEVLKKVDYASCVIPTMETRRDWLAKCLKRLEYCKIPLKIVIPDYYSDKPLSDKFVYDYNDKKGLHEIVALIPHNKIGLGWARHIGQKYVVENIDCDYILQLDDDCLISKTDRTIERLISVLYQDKRFGCVAPAGGYARMWYPNFGKESVKFYHCISVLFAMSMDVVKELGDYEASMKFREELEYEIRMWLSGYFVAAVWAGITHKRSSTGQWNRNSSEWKKCNQFIKDKYGDIVRVYGTGGLGFNKKEFKYPDIKFKLTYDLEDANSDCILIEESR